jgi:hypothetical protein
MLAQTDGGRKALVIFSDGEDNSSAHHMLDAIEAAQTNNVLLFCVRYTEVHNQRLTARNKYGTSVMARIAKETGGADFDAREEGLAGQFQGNRRAAAFRLRTRLPHDQCFGRRYLPQDLHPPEGLESQGKSEVGILRRTEVRRSSGPGPVDPESYPWAS